MIFAYEANKWLGINNLSASNAKSAAKALFYAGRNSGLWLPVFTLKTGSKTSPLQ
ncbi:MAG TPA: hypothetical protein VGX94_15025 [Terriglobia bacterium]|nr:hypothetical protein [Terriglobia bacterium]